MKKYKKLEKHEGFKESVKAQLMELKEADREDELVCEAVFASNIRKFLNEEGRRGKMESKADQSSPKQDYFMSSDEILSCFIYVLIKARAFDMPALLTFVGYFTLEEHQDEFEFVKTTLLAAILFITTQVAKLCEPTLHYTYRDDKSCFDEKTQTVRESDQIRDSMTSLPEPPSQEQEKFLNDFIKEQQKDHKVWIAKHQSLYSRYHSIGID